MHTLVAILLSLVILHILYRWYRFVHLHSRLKTIPAVGGDGFVSSYISAWKGALFGQQELFEEGYYKYPNSLFKVPILFTGSGWAIMANGPELFDDIRKAPSSQLSFSYMAAKDMFQSDYLSGIPTYPEPYHINAIRVSLTREYGSRFPDVQDEITVAFEEQFPATKDWSSHQLGASLVRVISRASSRLLVGLPFCRNQEYLSLSENLAIHMFMMGSFLQIVPEFMRPIFRKILSRDPATHEAILAYLGPYIEKRLEKENDLGPNWEGRPNDYVSWLIDASPPHLRTTKDLVQRLMVTNTASIHTSTVVTSNALFHLAAHPQYIEPLRAEIEAVVAEYGWTKNGISSMVQLDAFLKEASRLGSFAAGSLLRRVMKDFQFSDGTVIPAGCTLGVVSHARHRDPSIYEDPEVFNPSRFLQTDAPLRHQMVALDQNFLLFGHGRHACPGRFFATTEIKAIIAHVLVNYDIKLPDGQNAVPKGRWLAAQYVPDRSAQVMLRRRSKV